jgi:diadenosine tetraphosphate (Ap4A) HIT family hydrolase
LFFSLWSSVTNRYLYSGHVLVIPQRLAKRFSELTKDEVTDLWLSAQMYFSHTSSR